MVKKVEAPVAPPADPAVAPEEVAPAPALSFPCPKEELMGTPMEAVLRNWAGQAARGLIQICKEEGCYYPLTPKLDDKYANTHQRRFVGGRAGVAGKCSWDPAHGGGEQIIFDPLKSDDDVNGL